MGERRLLWISVELPDRDGQGGQRRQFHQIAALSARGWQITVLTPKSAQRADSVAAFADVRRPVVHLRGRRMPFALSRLRRLIRSPRWDAIVVSHHESAWLLPEDSAAPVLLDLHNVMSHWHRRRGRLVDERAALAAESSAALRADAVMTCSEVESARFAEMHPDVRVPVFTAPLGVDPSEWDGSGSGRTFPRTEPRVLLFGTWGWEPNRRGLDWFAREVWPRVLERFPEAVGEIAGTGVRDDLVLPDRLRTVGRVDDLAAATSAATVIAVPVKDGVGAAVKFAESLASGAAVAATSDGANAFPTLPIADTALLVSDDAERWAEWIAARLSRRGDEPAPSPARAVALTELTWDRAVEPIDRWLRSATSTAAPGAGGR